MIRLIYACIFIWSISVFSQEKTRTIALQNSSLSEVITIVEKKFNIKFSYIDSLLDNKTVSITFESKTPLKEVLKLLQQKTNLKFINTGGSNVTISSFGKKDKVSVCGYILDDEQNPLEGVSIFIKSIKTKITTDQKGYFEHTEVPYNTILLVSAPGFSQKVLYSSSFLANECMQVAMLHYQEEQLDEIIVQEYLTKGITQKKKVITIDLTDVDVLPGRTEPDILQSIQLTPGVNNPFETASGLYVRGSTPHQNLVLWNGIKTYQQGHFFGMLSAFNPYVAKEVNFYKSGVSARYGDRIAGVVDITSQEKVGCGITYTHY